MHAVCKVLAVLAALANWLEVGGAYLTTRRPPNAKCCLPEPRDADLVGA